MPGRKVCRVRSSHHTRAVPSVTIDCDAVFWPRGTFLRLDSHYIHQTSSQRLLSIENKMPLEIDNISRRPGNPREYEAAAR